MWRATVVAAILAVLALLAVFQPSAQTVAAAIVLMFLAVPFIGVVHILWTAWRDNMRMGTYYERMEREDEGRRAQAVRERYEFELQQREVVLEEYERGYAEEQVGEPPAPWMPVLEDASDEQQAFVAEARTAYAAGRADAGAGKPNRVKVWRESGGTVDGPLPKLRDRAGEG